MGEIMFNFHSCNNALEWDRENLETFKRKNPEIHTKFIESLSINLVTKLMKQNVDES